MGMEIRVATVDDLADLVTVQREVHEIHVRTHPAFYRNATDADLLEAMKSFLASEQYRAWIATADGDPAGFLLFRLNAVPENAFCYARNEASVEQIGVVRRFQRQGIGRALMSEAVRFAVSHGCAELRLTVLATNAAARPFYDALGFVDFSRRLRKAL